MNGKGASVWQDRQSNTGIYMTFGQSWLFYGFDLCDSDNE